MSIFVKTVNWYLNKAYEDCDFGFVLLFQFSCMPYCGVTQVIKTLGIKLSSFRHVAIN